MRSKRTHKGIFGAIRDRRLTFLSQARAETAAKTGEGFYVEET